MRVTNQLTGLKGHKPEFIRQFYDQAKQSEIEMSEIEIRSKVDYEQSKLFNSTFA